MSSKTICPLKLYVLSDRLGGLPSRPAMMIHNLRLEVDTNRISGFS